MSPRKKTDVIPKEEENPLPLGHEYVAPAPEQVLYRETPKCQHPTGAEEEAEEYDYATRQMNKRMMPVLCRQERWLHYPLQKTEFDAYSASLAEFQARGYCGDVMYSGKRCTNRIVVWFGDDDNNRVGACGQHADAVKEQWDRNASSRSSMALQRYMDAERERVVNILNNAGIKAQATHNGINIRNWGVLLAWLDGKGFDYDDRDWKKVAEEQAAAAAARICQNCLREHEQDDNYYPACDPYLPHKFFAMKNNKDRCAICEGPEAFMVHDDKLLGKGGA